MFGEQTSSRQGGIAKPNFTKTCRLFCLFSLMATSLCTLFSGAPGEAAEIKNIRNELTPKHVSFSGVSAYLVPEKGLVPDKAADRFVSTQRNIEILAVSIESPYKEIQNGFTNLALASRGVQVKSRSELTINGAGALLIKALHENEGRKWGKWILLLEDGESRTLLLNGIFVSGDENAAKDVENMLKSVVLQKNDTTSADSRGRPGKN